MVFAFRRLEREPLNRVPRRKRLSETRRTPVLIVGQGTNSKTKNHFTDSVPCTNSLEITLFLFLFEIIFIEYNKNISLCITVECTSIETFS